jgi:hypothetical protein
LGFWFRTYDKASSIASCESPEEQLCVEPAASIFNLERQQGQFYRKLNELSETCSSAIKIPSLK